jgi:hypothetical protein
VVFEGDMGQRSAARTGRAGQSSTVSRASDNPASASPQVKSGSARDPLHFRLDRTWKAQDKYEARLSGTRVARPEGKISLTSTLDPGVL